MKNRRIQFLSFLLLLSLLAGCSSTTQKTESDPSAPPQPSEPVPASASPIPSAEPVPTPDPEEEARKQRLKEAQDGFVWEDGYLYAIDDEGNLKTDCWIGILYFGKDGRYTCGSKKLDRLVAEIISENTKDSMTRMEKLEAMYNYTRDHIKYVGYGNHEMTYEPAHGKDGWMIEIAEKAIEEGNGNCYYFSAEFCALARGLGYQAYAVGGVFSAMDDPHSWVFILDEDGNEWLCDPEMEYRLHYWVEELNGGTVSSYFYRNQQELEGETGTGYGQVKDPYAAEQKAAEEREKAASAKTTTGTAKPGTADTGATAATGTGTPTATPTVTPTPTAAPTPTATAAQTATPAA